MLVDLVKAIPHRLAEYAHLLVAGGGTDARTSDSRPVPPTRFRSFLPLPYRRLESEDFPQCDHFTEGKATRRSSRAAWLFILVSVLNYHYMLGRPGSKIQNVLGPEGPCTDAQ